MNPFEFCTAINNHDHDFLNEDNEKLYNSYMVNRNFSYYQDTVLLANEMNRYHKVDNKLQFDFLINTFRKRKRYSKWEKPRTFESVNAIKEYYGYSDEKAHQVLPLLSENQINSIIKKVSRGGTRRN